MARDAGAPDVPRVHEPERAAPDAAADAGFADASAGVAATVEGVLSPPEFVRASIVGVGFVRRSECLPEGEFEGLFTDGPARVLTFRTGLGRAELVQSCREGHPETLWIHLYPSANAGLRYGVFYIESGMTADARVTDRDARRRWRMLCQDSTCAPEVSAPSRAQWSQTTRDFSALSRLALSLESALTTRIPRRLAR